VEPYIAWRPSNIGATHGDNHISGRIDRSIITVELGHESSLLLIRIGLEFIESLLYGADRCDILLGDNMGFSSFILETFRLCKELKVVLSLHPNGGNLMLIEQLDVSANRSAHHLHEAPAFG